MKKPVFTVLFCFLVVSVFSDIQWKGTWYRSSLNNSAEITISIDSEETFAFTITAFSGANIGQLEGFALMVNDHASALINEFDVESEVFFKHNGSSIVISTKNCEIYAGNGVSFDGIYQNTAASEINLATQNLENVLGKKNLVEKIRTVTRDRFPYISTCMDIVSTGPNLDDFSATVIVGCVHGICPFMQAIIMYTPEEEFFIALTEDEVIHYYTSVQSRKKTPPNTILDWTANYPGQKIIFHQDI
ncbi:MAG: hypothetical protein JW904_00680 [Spirochaetales bacterium]|nr:hypothetical protein [Spirochaetales bacterium]